MSTTNEMYGVKDIMALAKCKPSHAYKLIRDLNNELREQGYLIPKSGRVPAAYWHARTCPSKEILLKMLEAS